MNGSNWTQAISQFYPDRIPANYLSLVWLQQGWMTNHKTKIDNKYYGSVEQFKYWEQP